jgi:CheY-like chemotaxis protein
MFKRYFDVLVVDDEPDFLALSNMVMKDFTVYGLPIKIHTAKSKEEAIDLLNGPLATGIGQMPGMSEAFVAFIDVVMETDTAGLELCQYIREQMKNQMTQLYVRTGQPGVAPERSVVDQYDINGYFTKVEATEDKLYTLVKSGIRQAYFMSTAITLDNLLQWMIAESGSRQGMANVVNQAVESIQFDAQGNTLEGIDIRVAAIVDDRVVAGAWGASDEEALQVRDTYLALPGAPVGDEGDTYYREGNDLLIKIAAGPRTSEAYVLLRAMAPLPDAIALLFHGFARSVATLWRQAAVPA